VIGSLAGLLVIESVLFIERRLKVDDPVGAISVHGICGSFGVLCVGIFSSGDYGIDALAAGVGWNGTANNLTGDGVARDVTGVLYGSSGWGQLASQAIGVLTIWTVIFGTALLFFRIQNAVTKGGIRSTEEDEVAGLDLAEMGVLAYPEFSRAYETGSSSASTPGVRPIGLRRLSDRQGGWGVDPRPHPSDRRRIDAPEKPRTRC